MVVASFALHYCSSFQSSLMQVVLLTITCPCFSLRHLNHFQNLIVTLKRSYFIRPQNCASYFRAVVPITHVYKPSDAVVHSLRNRSPQSSMMSQQCQNDLTSFVHRCRSHFRIIYLHHFVPFQRDYIIILKNE